MSDKLTKGADDQLVIETTVSVTNQKVQTLDQLKAQKDIWVKTKQNAQEHIDYYTDLIAQAKALGVLTQAELDAKRQAEEEALKQNP